MRCAHSGTLRRSSYINHYYSSLASSTIIFAGFDNTANAICRILYILAREPKVQAQVRREIRQAKLAHAESGDTWEGGRWQDADLPYNVLMGLPYLDAILRETLRVHPPTSLLRRTYGSFDPFANVI